MRSHFRFTAGGLAHRIISSFVFWIADIIVSVLTLWLIAQLSKLRPILTKTGNFAVRTWRAARSLRRLALINGDTGEIVYGFGNG